MSDVSQGPGWWQATDNLWYAPEQHPDYVATRATAVAVAEPQTLVYADPNAPGGYAYADPNATNGYASVDPNAANGYAYADLNAPGGYVYADPTVDPNTANGAVYADPNVPGGYAYADPNAPGGYVYADPGVDPHAANGAVYADPNAPGGYAYADPNVPGGYVYADPAAAVVDPNAANGYAAAEVAPDDAGAAVAISTTTIGVGTVPGTPSPPAYLRKAAGIAEEKPKSARRRGGDETQQLGGPPKTISLNFHSELYLGLSGASGGVNKARGALLRRHSTLVIGLLIVLLAGAGGAAYWLNRPATPKAPVSPLVAKSITNRAELTQAVNAAVATHSFHVSASGDVSGNGTGSTLTGDISAADLSLQESSPENGSAQVIVIGGDAYANGDTTFLEGAGLDAGSASQYAGQWIDFGSPSNGLSDTVSSVSMDSLVQQTALLTGIVTDTPATLNGQAVINMAGIEPNSTSPVQPDGISAVVSLAAAAPHLPVQVVINGPDGATIEFSNWGETVAPGPPPNPVLLNYIEQNAS